MLLNEPKVGEAIKLCISKKDTNKLAKMRALRSVRVARIIAQTGVPYRRQQQPSERTNDSH